LSDVLVRMFRVVVRIRELERDQIIMQSTKTMMTLTIPIQATTHISTIDVESELYL
jgi:hypothetical protein